MDFQKNIITNKTANMKTTIRTIGMIALVVFTLASCSKDNVVEFTSTGEWRLDRYYFNGSDNTDVYLQTNEDYLLNLKASKDFTETAIVNDAPYGVTGTWEVTNDAKTLRLYDSYNGTREYEITFSSVASLKIKKGVEEWALKRP